MPFLERKQGAGVDPGLHRGQAGQGAGVSPEQILRALEALRVAVNALEQHAGDCVVCRGVGEIYPGAIYKGNTRCPVCHGVGLLDCTMPVCDAGC